MYRQRWVRWLAPAAILVLASAGLGVGDKPSDSGAVTFDVVTFKQLSDVISQLKGKVVVVDFWQTT